MTLKGDVLAKVKPSEKERSAASAIAKDVLNNVHKEGYEAVIAGSFPRETALSPIKDVDIFVYFPQNVSKNKMEAEILLLGRKILKKPVMHFAEHPYVRGYSKKLLIELVPCYKIREGERIISAVDRTPLHNEYLKANLKQGHIDDVLLLKQFLKNIECYGADQKTKGFSGYLCELLVLNYGTFEKLMDEAAKWQKKTVIDIRHHGRNINQFVEPLAVIDPVDPERNVASAVDRTTLSKFIWACRRYLEKPSSEAFFRKAKKISIKERIKGRKIISVSMGYPEVIGEIGWSQLEKLAGNIKARLHENEFTVYRAFYWTDEKSESVVIIELLEDELNAFIKHKGPEIWDQNNSKAFIEKNPDYWFSRSCVYAWKKREHVTAEGLIKSMLDKEGTAPSHFKPLIKKAKIRTGKDVAKHKEAMGLYFREG